MRNRALLILVVAACSLSGACGGSGGGLTPSTPGVDLSATPHSRAEALAQLDALPTPPGVDKKVFAEIKAAMRAILETADPARFVSTAPVGMKNRIEDLTTGIDDNGAKGLQWNYKNAGDYDMNRQVNINDLTRIGVHFHKSKSSPDWKTAAQFADGDGNGEVNLGDIVPIGINFLHTVAAYRVEGAAATAGPFTLVGQVPYSAGTPLLAGIRMYHHVPAVQYPVYRVVPIDDDGNEGEPSSPSIEFLISDVTRVVGGPGGPTFLSRSGDNLRLLLPTGAPNPISPGDVVVGAERGGYLLRALDVQRTGDELDIAGEPGILADVFLQGGLADVLSDLSQVPPAVYTFDLSGQVLHSEKSLTATIIGGSVMFLPQADVAVNYNQYGGVTYLRGLVLGGPLDLDMTVDLNADNWSGDFPPTPNDVPFFEHKMTGLTFNFTAYQNDVPVTMALQYDVYVGIRGTGTLSGSYLAHIISTYDNIKMGGIYNSHGIEDFNEYTPSHGAVEDPTVGTSGGDFSFTAYVRPEIHTRLYGNPVPGNTEDLALTLAPQFTLTGARTTTPEAGYDYVLDGSMDTSYMLALHHIGLESAQTKSFIGLHDTVLSGFIPDAPP